MTEREIIIDTEAPIVRVLTRSHNIRPGGSNVVAYALSEPCEINGVQVADQFYPGSCLIQAPKMRFRSPFLR